MSGVCVCVCVLDCEMKWMCGCSSRAIECEDLCFKRWEDIEEVLRGKKKRLLNTLGVGEASRRRWH